MSRVSKKGRKQECRLCKKRFVNLAAHEIMHYRDKTGVGYRIECPNCYRSFETLEAMKHHNLTTHSATSKFSYQDCFICQKIFLSRNVRDQHVATHFKAISDGILDNLEEVHKRVGASLISNQCPLCFYVMSTRKSFRHHLIFQHVLRDKFSLGLLLGSKVVHAEEERSLVRLLLNSPGLLWKRQAAKNDQKNAVNLSRLLDAEPEDPKRTANARVKEESPTESSAHRRSGGVKSTIPETARGVSATPNTKKLDQSSSPYGSRSSKQPSPHPWEGMRSELLSKCLDSTSPSPSSSSARVWRCRVCSDSFDNQISFEVHVGVKHMALALRREDEEERDPSKAIREC